MIVESIRPVPTDEEAAAIIASVAASWPEATDTPTLRSKASGWRFSGRWWRGQASRRRQRPSR